MRSRVREGGGRMGGRKSWTGCPTRVQPVLREVLPLRHASRVVPDWGTGTRFPAPRHPVTRHRLHREETGRWGRWPSAAKETL